MSYAPARGEHWALHNAQPVCGFIPQQHRGQGCHTTCKTSAQGETRASFILELVQGHSLLVALDINHTIACENSAGPSAYPGVSPQGQSQGGEMFRGHTPALGTHCSPAAWQGSPPGRSAPGPGGSHCHLEVPRWHCLARGFVHEHAAASSPTQVAACPVSFRQPVAWSRAQLLMKHKPTQRGFRVLLCNPRQLRALHLPCEDEVEGRCRSPPRSATQCLAGPTSAADEEVLCQAMASSAANR